MHSPPALKGWRSLQSLLEREIEEETGFVVSIDFPLKVRTDRTTGRLDLAYVGYFCGGEFRKSDEVYEYGFFPLQKLPLLIKSQVIMIKEAFDKKTAVSNKLSSFSSSFF